jgi:hypothetical protein
MRFVPLLGLGLALLVAAAPARTQNALPNTGLDAAAVNALLKQFNVPGVSVAIIRDFTIVSAAAYGVASGSSTRSG